MLSWLIGNRLPERRDRRLVAWAGVAPDLDGLTVAAGLEAYDRWHHILTHGLMTAVVVTVLFATFARDRLKVAGFALLTFHVHLVCDLLGSGVQWPLVYFWPFSSHEYHMVYGWELDSWQNWLIAVAALLACGRIGVVHGRTFAETFLPAKVDASVVETLRRRFSSRASRDS
jgi:hypothetical protein